jgi:hypothetical protein
VIIMNRSHHHRDDLDGMLRALAEADRSERAAPRVEEAVMGEWDRVAAEPRRAFDRESRLRRLRLATWQWVPAGAALALVALALVVGSRESRPEQAALEPAATAGPAARPGLAAPAAGLPETLVELPASPGPAPRVPVESATVERVGLEPAGPAALAAAPVEPEVEIATFVPLSPAFDLPPAGTVQMMRVRLPSYALGAFGVPVDRIGEGSVQADVLVGEDGLARAIRFVR